MRKLLRRLKDLLNLIVQDDFKYFERIKNPDKTVSNLLKELYPHLDRKRKLWVSKVLKLFENYDSFTKEQKKRFFKELHSVILLKFSEEEIEKARKEEIPRERIFSSQEKFERKKTYPIKAFFQPISTIKGIKKKTVERLKKLSIETILDAIYYLPFRYEDRTTITPMSFLKPGQVFLVKGKVVNVLVIETSKKKKKILKVILYDKTGTVTLIFLQERVLNYYKMLFSKAKELEKEVLAYGIVKREMGSYSMVHPEVEIFDKNRGKLEKLGVILPVYHSSEGIKQSTIRKDIGNIVKRVIPFLPEYLPQELLKRYSFPDIATAFWRVHFPFDEDAQDLLNFKTPSQKRVIFDELFLFQLALALHKQKIKGEKGIAFPVKKELVDEFKKALPFSLTNAQEKVLREIMEDMKKDEPMNRLVQGDVGSGKTVVAAAAAFFAAKSGYQTAVMAPTEILANQHFKKFREFLKPFSIKVGLLTGSMTKKEKETMYRAIKEGFIQVVVGTHALIQETVEFKNLGLAIIDEQHRFGVKQRVELKKKGKLPDVLVMTATPIPRTLAMTAYGDLDISVIDELPAGRKPIKTKILFEDERDTLVRFLLKELKMKNRVYIVYPLIEESEKLELKAATEMHHYWEKKLKPYSVGLLHGKMKQEEKDEIMEKFKRGEYQVLVSTTVIEVGVDVPEATVMVIEHAERFGLAQLHQLRGRVGRGNRQSYCFLITKRSISEDSIKRLRVLESTNDGFKIAEADLQFRGPGEIFGTRQSGLGDFKIADLRRDFEILKIAREEAQKLVERNPELEGLNDLKELMRFRFGEKFDFVEVG
ncbi:ATP-dependent DNA helicase RecG [Desulfurobacterium thermolithotrophum DSM 11699]|uniref:ATP-dependent DNA helicase RecG n=1 Tax=Desulfurobacterium thermolithotrophum (strain DSM 11699 / BSA) TaxID=868864 RepID=F0S131_DESTD|nr:ATP-dependent DNA helicase RecG [Desulfurobacterium thermolithotrophum]ADY73909.1 ATP-dependent DNA helicase RecG [Desulfurobacterium thermolithotrophum DSM 11699]